ncbi:hypothetical protein K2173_007518 [Erythroxylum novogranatense]|uniref:Transcription repressor n=1 Tax=Erythroxylum novogranatense TaxID=1862640 RepID=A0AAV8T817_9ROSI|nr:hypothetical protein K2173_007518 [Erythroxylum novogranatense]
MSKRLKLKISRVITSFQLCRRAKIPSSVVNPVSRCPSSSKPKSSVDGFNRAGAAERWFFKRHPLRKVNCVAGCSSGSRSLSPEYFSGEKIGNYLNMPCTSFGDRSDGDASPIIVTPIKSSYISNKRTRRTSSLSTEDGFSFIQESEEIEETTEETEALLFSSRSFSYDSSHECSLESEANCSVNEVINPTMRKAINNNIQKVLGKRNQVTRTRKGSSQLEILSQARTSFVQRINEESSDSGKMRESVAVVKKSENPYEDFKTSMLEMILEKQMYEVRDLEELLECFLCLNSKQYHEIIVDVFSEIWDLLFCESFLKNC